MVLKDESCLPGRGEGVGRREDKTLRAKRASAQRSNARR